MHRFHIAKREQAAQVQVWGTGRPRREFLHVDDLAAACIFLLETYDGPSIVNVGCGKDQSIGEVAALVQRVVGYEGELVFDPSKPDGTPQKLLDVSTLFAMGWRPTIPLAEGLTAMYRWFLEHEASART
jgi:GDP-L-fucose synthase